MLDSIIIHIKQKFAFIETAVKKMVRDAICYWT